MLQRMYEVWLGLGDSVSQEVRRIILERLRGTHSAWANWYLENERYDDAQEEMSKTIGFGLAPKVVMKWALTWSAPGLARKLSPKSRPYL